MQHLLPFAMGFMYAKLLKHTHSQIYGAKQRCSHANKASAEVPCKAGKVAYAFLSALPGDQALFA